MGNDSLLPVKSLSYHTTHLNLCKRLRYPMISFLQISISPKNIPSVIHRKKYLPSTICILPIPVGTYPENVVWGTHSSFTSVSPIFQDSLGKYYIHVPIESPSQHCYLGVKYMKNLDISDKPPPTSSTACYQAYSLTVPSLLQDCISDTSSTRQQKLETLHYLFTKMTYDKIPKTAHLYRNLKGETQVNRFLETHRGCCYEFSQAFAAVISHFLGYTVRIISGLQKTSNNRLTTHAWVEVLIDGSWKLFDPTPSLESEHSHDFTDSRDVLPFFESFRRSMKYKHHHQTDGDKARKKETLILTKSTIHDWCYEHDYVRSSIRISKLPCSHKEGTLSLSHLHHTHKRLYNQPQTQSGTPFPYVEVVVFYQDDHNPDSQNYLNALIEMQMPIYVALANPPRLQKISTVSAIPWKDLARQSDYDLTKENASMIPLSKILLETRPKKITPLYMGSPTFKEHFKNLNEDVTIRLYVNSLDPLEWLIQQLSNDLRLRTKKILKIDLDLPDSISIKHEDLLIRLVQMCTHVRALQINISEMMITWLF